MYSDEPSGQIGPFIPRMMVGNILRGPMWFKVILQNHNQESQTVMIQASSLTIAGRTARNSLNMFTEDWEVRTISRLNGFWEVEQTRADHWMIAF